MQKQTDNISRDGKPGREPRRSAGEKGARHRRTPRGHPAEEAVSALEGISAKRKKSETEENNIQGLWDCSRHDRHIMGSPEEEKARDRRNP